LTLATALIYYQSPKNHAEAQSLFDGILKRKITSTTALIGSGLILEEQGRYGEAAEFLDRALNRDETNVRVRAEAAWCQALDGDYHTGVEVLRVCADQMDTRDPKSRDLKAQTVYRIGMCIWNVYPDFKSRKDRKGAYSYFLEALKGNINYAPAYTILGSYYADYARDQKRARKCFQKAFELSALETEAAERLARSFADSGDWDLVEVVAARVVDSGKARPSPGSNKKGFSWPFAALGVVQLNKQAFADAIVSFQSSLRISPHEYHSWVGLGESYHSSGRYIAATRAFQQAERYESEAEESQNAEKWFARYMLANVKRELGDFEDAIQGYRSVITSRPREFGVSVALVQTLVEYGWRSVEQGFFGRAADCAVGAIKVAVDMAESKVNAFNLWKAVGDACSVFSWIPDQSSQFPLQPVQKFFDHGHEILTTRILEELDGTSPSTVRQLKDEPNTLFQSSLLTAVVAQKGAILVSANDVHAQAVAWYNLGWTEYRAYACLSDDISESKRKSSRGHLKASMKCFKKAIELETGNSEFWNALGLATTNLSPKVAQHSFIRSLFLNDKASFLQRTHLSHANGVRVLEYGRILAPSTCYRTIPSSQTRPSLEHSLVIQIMLKHGLAKGF
jgi:superkiller protein 3